MKEICNNLVISINAVNDVNWPQRSYDLRPLVWGSIKTHSRINYWVKNIPVIAIEQQLFSNVIENFNKKVKSVEVQKMVVCQIMVFIYKCHYLTFY